MELLDSQALVLTKHHYRQLPRASLGCSSLPPAHLPLRTGAGITPGSPMVTCKTKQRSGPSVGKGSPGPPQTWFLQSQLCSGIRHQVSRLGRYPGPRALSLPFPSLTWPSPLTMGLSFPLCQPLEVGKLGWIEDCQL